MTSDGDRDPIATFCLGLCRAGRHVVSPALRKCPLTFLAKFGGGDIGGAILALFKTRAPHGLSL